MKNQFITFLFVSLLGTAIQAQDDQKKFTLSGYITNMESFMADSGLNKQFTITNLFHNRLNFKYIPFNGLSMALEMRNRLQFEENPAGTAVTASNFSTDYGFLNLTRNISQGNSYVLNSTLDRLWISYEGGKTRLTFGRQRINWGQTLVWNPNDIFNAYSFFDFDYVEKPGSDALRLQYYNSVVSSFELAAKLNSANQLTAAAMYKFNVFEYDFQFLGGTLNQTDYVLGMGWSGAIGHIAFRGELSYFQPVKNFKDTTGILLASVSLDYTFGNSSSILAEYLYDGNKVNSNVSFTSFLSAPLTVKNLSFVNHNFVVQATYPITPLLTGTLSGMFFPGINGYFAGPSLTYSLGDNLEAGLYDQSFSGKIGNNSLQLSILYIRIKYNF